MNESYVECLVAKKNVQCDESTAGFSDCPGGDFFPA